jgi:hypothetical protein
MRNLILIIYILFPLLAISQENENDTKNHLEVEQIDEYVRSVENNPDFKNERTIIGELKNKKFFEKNSKYILSYINSQARANELERIKYSETFSDRIENLTLYYKNNRVVFVEITLTLTKKKFKKALPRMEKFYFKDNVRIFQTNKFATSAFYIIEREKEIRKIIN